jgi:Rrf2 family protein
LRKDSRLSRVLHVLLHMARHDAPFTSEEIARMLRTDPTVVRRTLAGLRDAGFVGSEKGHHGGCTIGRPLAEVTLLDVHRALGMPTLFAIGSGEEDGSCAVEAVVNAALRDSLADAEARLLARFGEVTLADLAGQFDQRCIEGGWDGAHAHAHS